MAKKTAVWKGSKQIHLQPGYPKLFARADGEGYRFEWRGPYQTLRAKKPAIGSVIAGYPGYYVDDVTAEPEGAGPDGPGVMRATVTSTVAGGTSSPTDETKVVIESGRLDKSIYACPAFDSISKADKLKLKKAVENGEAVPGPTFPGPVSEPLQELYNALADNQEGYVESAPVVKITTFSHTRPTAGRTGRGTRTTEKPHPAAPDGYEWLKTVDDINQDGKFGKWQRIVMWEAADVWRPYVYNIPPSVS